jgi:hypothetical protein
MAFLSRLELIWYQALPYRIHRASKYFIPYFLEINEQIMQDSAPAGISILKSLKREYAIIQQNAGRKRYSNVFSVLGSPCLKIESKGTQSLQLKR